MGANGERFHAHVYYDADERPTAAALRERLGGLRGADCEPRILYVGRMADGPVGPHPLPQFEIHFAARSHDRIVAELEATGLRALVHPLTDDDLADHTTHAHWIGEPLALDLTVLDPPGASQGAARFGISDF